MKSNKTVLIALGIPLAISLLANAILIQRLNRAEQRLETPRTSRHEPAPSSAPREVQKITYNVPSRDSQQMKRVLQEISVLRQEVAGALSDDPSGAPAIAPISPLPIAISDPKVAEVLREKEEFRVFWNNLSKVHDARDTLDERSYNQAVMEATMEFLNLGAGDRPRFVEATNFAVKGIVEARRQYGADRAALPPKNDPNYRTQYGAVRNSYKERLKTAYNYVTSQLDPNQTRHGEFADRTERWLNKLTPK